MDDKKTTQESVLEILYAKGLTIRDIDELCAEHNISREKTFRYIAEMRAPACCSGCMHVVKYPGLDPCDKCAHPRTDYYEPHKGD